MLKLMFFYLTDCSYRDNPTLGDPNTLIEELLEMRNKIRVKEAELGMTRAKVTTITCCINIFFFTKTLSPPVTSFTTVFTYLYHPPLLPSLLPSLFILSSPSIPPQLKMFMSLVEATPPEMSFQLSSPIPPSSSPPLTSRHPRKSVAGLVSGRDHDFVESEKRRPALCAYCGGMIQREEWDTGGREGRNEREGGRKRER